MRQRDHPRAGGEKAATFRAVCGPRGSPPRGRGKVAVNQRFDQALRITPAWAGKSYRVYHCLASCWNHPRKAGKRNWTIGSRLLNWDHPRVGGEKTKSIHPYPVLDGSPPHGRGKEAQDRAFAAARRITPAWAGKSRCSSAKGKAVQNHPRVGGEKNKELEGVWLPMESPPRRRGKERSTALVGTPTRITPAWAGKSFFHLLYYTTPRDHPRMGGENIKPSHTEPPGVGSPPHGRGKY